MGAATITVTEATFETEVLKSKTPVLVDFWAEWCAPCKAVTPILEELSEKYRGKITVAKVNVDQNANIAVRYGILNIPTLIFFKNGQEVDRLVGLQPKAQLDAKFQKLAG